MAICVHIRWPCIKCGIEDFWSFQKRVIKHTDIYIWGSLGGIFMRYYSPYGRVPNPFYMNNVLKNQSNGHKEPGENADKPQGVCVYD